MQAVMHLIDPVRSVLFNTANSPISAAIGIYLCFPFAVINSH